MALVTCPECSQKVSDTADSCPQCGYDFKGEKKKKDTASGCGCLIVIVAVLTLYFTCFDNSEPSSVIPSEPSLSLAYLYAQECVTRELKSPASAEFPGMSVKEKHTTSLGNNEFQITSYVDSQNSFGAMIRSNFTCKIRVSEDDTYFNCIDVVFF